MVIHERKGRVIAYISYFNKGLVAIDISDPRRPVEVARYTPQNELDHHRKPVYLNDDQPFPVTSDAIFDTYRDPGNGNQYLYLDGVVGNTYIIKEVDR